MIAIVILNYKLFNHLIQHYIAFFKNENTICSGYLAVMMLIMLYKYRNKM